MRAQRGFTLIEILVALLVFLTGVTGLLALITTALAMHRDGLQLARATRDLDGVVAQVRREVAAGQHYDAVHGAFTDVTAASLPDGTVYSVHFLPARGDQPLLAELRVGGSEKALPGSRPVPLVLDPGPSDEAAIARFRSRGRAPAGLSPETEADVAPGTAPGPPEPAAPAAPPAEPPPATPPPESRPADGDH